MKHKLHRLCLPHLQLFLTLGVDLLLVIETLVDWLGWLRPWLMPERRTNSVRIIGDRRQRFGLTPFGLLLWGTVIYIFYYISRSVDPRPGVILALEYGLVVCIYIYLRMAGRIKKSLV